MKIYMNEPSGYCDGVKRAIMLALNFKNNNKEKDVYVLGNLVHNEMVRIELENNGIHTIEGNASNEEKIKSLPNGSFLIFSAHGHDKKLEKLCNEKNITFCDATCPIVTMSMNAISEAIKNKHQIIFIGKKNHPETNAILSINKNIYLYDDIKENLKKFINDDEPYVYNQTTFSIFEIEDLLKDIKKHIPNAKITNEICNATRLRQEGILKLPRDVDLVYVIGGKNSSNTRRLYEIAKSHFFTLKIYQIINEQEITKEQIKNCRSVALISGASSPSSETRKIKIKLMD